MTTTTTTTAATTTMAGKAARKDRDETAVAAFVLGLMGLFFFNIVLGPLAIVLGGVTLARGTRRRGRALLGIALGIADLAVLGAVMAAHHGGFVWHFGI